MKNKPKKRGRPKKETVNEKSFKQLQNTYYWNALEGRDFWIAKIESYCQEMGITPEQLIDSHKVLFKKYSWNPPLSTTSIVINPESQRSTRLDEIIKNKL